MVQLSLRASLSATLIGLIVQRGDEVRSPVGRSVELMILKRYFCRGTPPANSGLVACSTARQSSNPGTKVYGDV